MEDIRRGRTSPGPVDESVLVRLRMLEAQLAEAEAEIRRLRAESVSARTSHPPAAHPRRAVATPAGALTRVAGDAMAWVARLSLVAQDQVDARIARRRAHQAARGPARRPDSERPRIGAVADRVTARLRGLAVDVRRRVAAWDVLLDARPRARQVAGGALRVTLAAAVTGVIAVQVLGIGRPSSGAPPVAEVVAPAPAPVLGPVADPDAAPDAASGPAPDPAPAPALAAPSARLAPPVSLRVPAIEVDAPVVIVGLEDDGETMEIPEDVRTVGWYEPFPGAGVIPGEMGTAVIAGHVDSRTQGRGAFWPLRELSPGDLIEVVHADGSTTRWRVDDVVRYPKTDIPIADIFTFDGDERIALITCGGEFDRSLGAYLDNYVVTASPLPPLIDGAGPTLPRSP